MEELKRCPFCGGEARLITERDGLGYIFAVRCNKYGCLVQTLYFSSKDKAITAWNRRAERTCKAEFRYGTDWPYCSACGCLMVPNFPYCPSCGAKVVGD